MKNIILIVFSLFAFQTTIAQELEILVQEALEYRGYKVIRKDWASKNFD